MSCKREKKRKQMINFQILPVFHSKERYSVVLLYSDIEFPTSWLCCHSWVWRRRQILAQLFTITAWLGNLSKQRMRKLTLVSGWNNLPMINKIDNFQFPPHSRLRPPVVNFLQISDSSYSFMFPSCAITLCFNFNPCSTICFFLAPHF